MMRSSSIQIINKVKFINHLSSYLFNMKKQIFALLIGTFLTCQAFAQEYKIAKTSGRLVIKMPSVSVEGYDGKDIVFTTTDKQHADERAAGLMLLSGSGLKDNTGIGLNTAEKGSDLEISAVDPSMGKVTIKVPKGLAISYNWQELHHSGKVTFKNIQKEIDISSKNSAVELDDVTGPVSINTLYASVKARFTNKVTGPITIASIYSTVDVAVPVATKANLKLNTTYGKVFAASDMKIDLKKRTEDEMVEYTGHIEGSLNGGGTDINLSSTYGKVYLRKTM
jgi:hypothetical protein